MLRLHCIDRLPNQHRLLRPKAEHLFWTIVMPGHRKQNHIVATLLQILRRLIEEVAISLQAMRKDENILSLT